MSTDRWITTSPISDRYPFYTRVNAPSPSAEIPKGAWHFWERGGACQHHAMSDRPFRVLGIQQVAIGGLDKGALSALWTGLLGIEKVGDYVAESENVDEDILRLGKGAHAVEIDLMQPLDPEVSPKVHVPTLNHLGLWIDDLKAAVEWLTEQGMRFTPGGIRKGASGHDVCFMHPKGNEATPRSGEGVLIELVQAPADVIAAL